VRRGDIYRLRAPRGARYGIVVQADALLALSTVVIAPTSTSARAASFRPEIEIAGEQTRVLVEQLGAVDRSRLGESAGALEATELNDVDDALALVLRLFPIGR
jgi:mRNA interferase MazF